MRKSARNGSECRSLRSPALRLFAGRVDGCSPQQTREDETMSEWRDWIGSHQILQMAGRGDLPSDYPMLWIMRNGWDKPKAISPREIPPMMNVSGLRWKPWTTPARGGGAALDAG